MYLERNDLKRELEKKKEQLYEVEAAYNIVAKTLNDAQTRVMQLEHELGTMRRNETMPKVQTWTLTLKENK